VSRPLGLFAGGGDFPRHLLAALRQAGHEVAVVGFRGETDPGILRHAALSFHAPVGEYGRMIEFMRKAGVREALMAGYVRHTNIYRKPRTDSLTSRILGGLLDRRADSLLKAAALRLRAAGITLVSAMPYLKSLIPERGVLTKRAPTPGEWKDIGVREGDGAADRGLDIGQTVWRPGFGRRRGGGHRGHGRCGPARRPACAARRRGGQGGEAPAGFPVRRPGGGAEDRGRPEGGARGGRWRSRPAARSCSTVPRSSAAPTGPALRSSPV